MNRRSSVAVIMTLVMAGSLSACVTGYEAGLPPVTPTSRYQLQVEPGLDRIALAVHEQGVSPGQDAALRDLVGRFAYANADVLVVEAPAGADPAAAAMAWRIRSTIEGLGVPADRIHVASYAGPDPRAPVLAGFQTARVVVPDCGQTQGDARANFANRAAPSFGCAITANMAVQIDNPRDIVQPRGMTAPDSGRAAVVFDNYRKGEATSSPQEELVRGRVANVVD